MNIIYKKESCDCKYEVDTKTDLKDVILIPIEYCRIHIDEVKWRPKNNSFRISKKQFEDILNFSILIPNEM